MSCVEREINTEMKDGGTITQHHLSPEDEEGGEIDDDLYRTSISAGDDDIDILDSTSTTSSLLTSPEKENDHDNNSKPPAPIITTNRAATITLAASFNTPFRKQISVSEALDEFFDTNQVFCRLLCQQAEGGGEYLLQHSCGLLTQNGAEVLSSDPNNRDRLWIWYEEELTHHFAGLLEFEALSVEAEKSEQKTDQNISENNNNHDHPHHPHHHHHHQITHTNSNNNNNNNKSQQCPDASKNIHPENNSQLRSTVQLLMAHTYDYILETGMISGCSAGAVHSMVYAQFLIGWMQELGEATFNELTKGHGGLRTCFMRLASMGVALKCFAECENYRQIAACAKGWMFFSRFVSDITYCLFHEQLKATIKRRLINRELLDHLVQVSNTYIERFFSTNSIPGVNPSQLKQVHAGFLTAARRVLIRFLSVAICPAIKVCMGTCMAINDDVRIISGGADPPPAVWTGPSEEFSIDAAKAIVQQFKLDPIRSGFMKMVKSCEKNRALLGMPLMHFKTHVDILSMINTHMEDYCAAKVEKIPIRV